MKGRAIGLQLFRFVALGGVRQDLRFAFRSFRRSPGLSIAIIGTIGLGVGANAALFTIVDRVFFQAPRAVVMPQHLRRLFVHQRGLGAREYTSDQFSVADQLSLKEAAGDSLLIEGYAVRENRTIDDENTPRTVGYITNGFFRLAGIRPYLGRFFLPTENEYGTPANVAVLSHDLWRSSYGADSAILGHTVRIDTATFIVVGVAPPGFAGMDLSTVEIWTPLASLPATGEGPWWNRSVPVMKLFARLSSTTNEATLAARLNARYRAINVMGLRGDPALRLEVAPLLRARGNLRYSRQDVRNIALLKRLGGIGLIVVLIATTNVASLLLMRAVRRRREMAVRLALGVSEQRLFLQLFTESLLLAVVGGVVALVIAWSAGETLRQLLFPGARWSALVVDHRLVAAVALITIFVACAAGLAPAALVRRNDLMESLKSGGVEAGRAPSRLRVGLLASQTALCTVMVMLAGVFTQSLRRASNIDLGYDAEHLITMSFAHSNPAQVDAALTKIASLPPVASVTRSNVDVVGGLVAGISFRNGDSVPASAGPTYAFVDSAYPSVLGLRLVSGRWLTESDRTEPSALVNEAMAQEYWPGRNPIGECFYARTVMSGCLRIVGVVGNVRWELTEAPLKWMYLPTPSPVSRCCTFVTVRTSGRATALVAAQIRQAAASALGVDAARSPNPRLVEDRHEPVMRPWRLTGIIFLVFATLALGAAAAGTYGVVAYDVAQRVHELGVRLTLGASRRHVLVLVLSSGVKVVLLGIGIGLVASVAVGRLTASLLFETAPYDPVVLGVSALTLVLMACLASLVPAWKATAIDPVVALRC